MKSILKQFAVASLSLSLIMIPVQTVFAQTLPEDNMSVLDYKELTTSRVETPNAIKMAADIVIARPLLLGATIIGTGVFIVSLPLSMLGNSVKQAGEQLVVVPAKATFFRCLGCTS